MTDISGAPAIVECEPVDVGRSLSREERTRQVLAVLALIEQGNSERASCLMVGINRHTFRFNALACGAASQYARATAALAHEQVARMEDVLARLEAGEIDPNAARVLVDARKWFASKFLPKQYGEHASVEHTHTHAIAELSEEQIRARLAELHAGEATSPQLLAEVPGLAGDSANE